MQALVNSIFRSALKVWVEHELSALDSFFLKDNHYISVIWEWIFSLDGRVFSCMFVFRVKVLSNIALFFFYKFNLISVAWCDSRRVSFHKKLVKIISQIFACKWNALDSKWNCISFVYWSCMSNAFTAVKNCTCCSASCKK